MRFEKFGLPDLFTQEEYEAWLRRHRIGGFLIGAGSALIAMILIAWVMLNV